MDFHRTGRWMPPYFRLPRSHRHRIRSGRYSGPVPRLLSRHCLPPSPISYHPFFPVSGSRRTAATLPFQIPYHRTDISVSVLCCRNGFRLHSRGICIPVILPCSFSDLFSLEKPLTHSSPASAVFRFRVCYFTNRYLTISPSSNGSPHSGQNFGGWAGSSGSQPHLSHL